MHNGMEIGFKVLFVSQAWSDFTHCMMAAESVIPTINLVRLGALGRLERVLRRG